MNVRRDSNRAHVPHHALEIAFHATGEPETFEHARYVLKVALPLGAASPA